MRRLLIVLALVGTAAVRYPRPAAAEHFDIVVVVRGQKGSVEGHWDTSPPEGGLNPRQMMTAGAGEDLTLDWSLRSEFPHGKMKSVRIHTYAAPIAATGQKAMPSTDAPHVFDNTFTADFLPKHAARGVLHFRLNQPGSYLLELRSEETRKEHGHEHFAAVEIQVQ